MLKDAADAGTVAFVWAAGGRIDAADPCEKKEAAVRDGPGVRSGP